jgi:hypothetical protein
VTFTGANNFFNGTAATPVQILNQNFASIYTDPQTTQNQLAFLTASATWKPSDTWTYQAIAYLRNFRQAHVDGNGTNASNDPAVCPDPTLLCFPNLDGTVSNLTTTRGQTIPNSGALGFPSVLGELTEPGRRPTASAARCRRHRPKSCLVTRIISRSG